MKDLAVWPVSGDLETKLFRNRELLFRKLLGGLAGQGNRLTR